MRKVDMEALLANETDLAGFREEARVLLAHQVPPESVHWLTARAGNGDTSIEPQAASRPQGVPKAASAIVPASFVRLTEVVVLHQDPGRFALLYRLLWRLVHEPGLRHDPVDADMLHAQQMAQSVRRDIQKLKTTLQFVTVDDVGALQLAWCEPAHHILLATVPWFGKQAPQGRFAIFTPRRSVAWKAGEMHAGGGVQRANAPPQDASADDWLALYRETFRGEVSQV